MSLVVSLNANSNLNDFVIKISDFWYRHALFSRVSLYWACGFYSSWKMYFIQLLKQFNFSISMFLMLYNTLNQMLFLWKLLAILIIMWERKVTVFLLYNLDASIILLWTGLTPVPPPVEGLTPRMSRDTLVTVKSWSNSKTSCWKIQNDQGSTIWKAHPPLCPPHYWQPRLIEFVHFFKNPKEVLRPN